MMNAFFLTSPIRYIEPLDPHTVPRQQRQRRRERLEQTERI